MTRRLPYIFDFIGITALLACRMLLYRYRTVPGLRAALNNNIPATVYVSTIDDTTMPCNDAGYHESTGPLNEAEQYFQMRSLLDQ